MSIMNRRGFLRFIGFAPAAAIAAKTRLARFFATGGIVSAAPDALVGESCPDGGFLVPREFAEQLKSAMATPNQIIGVQQITITAPPLTDSAFVEFERKTRAEIARVFGGRVPT